MSDRTSTESPDLQQWFQWAIEVLVLKGFVPGLYHILTFNHLYNGNAFKSYHVFSFQLQTN